MTIKEFENIQVLINKYNSLFIEADLLRYENHSFQEELLNCYREIAELKNKIEGNLNSEDLLSKLIPIPIDIPKQTSEPKPMLPVTVQKLNPEQITDIIVEIAQSEEKEKRKLPPIKSTQPVDETEIPKLDTKKRTRKIHKSE